MRRADQRHDVAEIDYCFRGQRHFLPSARHSRRNTPARAIADLIGYFGQCPAVQCLIANENAERITQYLVQHFGAFDFRTDPGAGLDERGGRSGKYDFISAFKNRRP